MHGIIKFFFFLILITVEYATSQITTREGHSTGEGMCDQPSSNNDTPIEVTEAQMPTIEGGCAEYIIITEVYDSSGPPRPLADVR